MPPFTYMVFKTTHGLKQDKPDNEFCISYIRFTIKVLTTYSKIVMQMLLIILIYGDMP